MLIHYACAHGASQVKDATLKKVKTLEEQKEAVETERDSLKVSCVHKVAQPCVLVGNYQAYGACASAQLAGKLERTSPNWVWCPQVTGVNECTRSTHVDGQFQVEYMCSHPQH